MWFFFIKKRIHVWLIKDSKKRTIDFFQDGKIAPSVCKGTFLFLFYAPRNVKWEIFRSFVKIYIQKNSLRSRHIIVCVLTFYTRRTFNITVQCVE